MFGMKPKDASLALAESYHVQEFSHEGGETYSLSVHDKTNSLLAGTSNGLLVMDCATNKIKMANAKVGAHITKLVSADEGVYCATVGGNIFSWNEKDDIFKLLYKGPRGELIYNPTNKAFMWCLQPTGVAKIDTTTGANQFEQIDNISALCWGPNGSWYVGMLNGNVQKRDAVGSISKQHQFDGFIKAIKRDPVTNTLFIQDNMQGQIKQCNADLGDITPISYALPSATTITFEHDHASKLLCILSRTYHTYGISVDSIHIVHSDCILSKNIKVMTLDGRYSLSTCDPRTSTFYIAGKNKISVVRPKKLYLALINQSAFTVFKMLLHMNKQAALEGEWI